MSNKAKKIIALSIVFMMVISVLTTLISIY